MNADVRARLAARVARLGQSLGRVPASSPGIVLPVAVVTPPPADEPWDLEDESWDEPEDAPGCPQEAPGEPTLTTEPSVVLQARERAITAAVAPAEVPAVVMGGVAYRRGPGGVLEPQGPAAGRRPWPVREEGKETPVDRAARYGTVHS